LGKHCASGRREFDGTGGAWLELDVGIGVGVGMGVGVKVGVRVGVKVGLQLGV
jgi:hypothetical protein